MSYELINPEDLGAPSGWTNGMLASKAGRILFVAGQDAATAEGRVETDELVEQFRLALHKALVVVRDAGGGPESVGRMTVFVTSAEEYRSQLKEIGAAYRSLMGKRFPAMALFEVRALFNPRARIELEVTAVIEDTLLEDI